MSDIQRDREERQHVIEVLKSWDGYFIGYTSDEVQEALRYAIASIRTDLKYDLLYEETSGQADKPTTKNDLGVSSGLEKNSKKLEKDFGELDCISRAQTQTKIEMNASRYTIAKERGGMGQVEWSDQLIKVSDAVDIIRHLPPATPQEPRWIKCSDHLPDFDVDVLATTKEYGDVVKVTRWRTILKDCGWEWILVDDIEGRAYNSDEIIAWMALPKAYREVEE